MELKKCWWWSLMRRRKVVADQGKWYPILITSLFHLAFVLHYFYDVLYLLFFLSFFLITFPFNPYFCPVRCLLFTYLLHTFPPSVPSDSSPPLRATADVRNQGGQSLLSIAAQFDFEDLARFLLTHWKICDKVSISLNYTSLNSFLILHDRTKCTIHWRYGSIFMIRTDPYQLFL